MTTQPDTVELRQSIIDACLWMNARGLNQGTSGNVSMRAAGGMVITPTAVPYAAMTPDMLVALPLHGDPAAGQRPSSEWRFHQRLLATRPDVAAVVHAHPPYCSALAVQRKAIPACHYMVAAFGGNDVPLVDYALFGSDDLARDVAAAMRQRDGCLMANHGATVVGETLERGLWRLEELEVLARTYVLSHLGGQPVLLTDAEIEAARRSFRHYGPGQPADRIASDAARQGAR